MIQRYTVLLESFQAGEVSPLLRGRVDTSEYSQGCRLLQNFISLPQGGITRREGSQFVSTSGPITEDEGGFPVLVPFIVDDSLAYTLEFSEETIRFYLGENSPESDFGLENNGPSALGGGTPTSSNGFFDSDISSWTASGSGSSAISWSSSGNGLTGTVRFNAPNDAAWLSQTISNVQPGKYIVVAEDATSSSTFVVSSSSQSWTLLDPPAPGDGDLFFQGPSISDARRVIAGSFEITATQDVHLNVYYAGTGQNYVGRFYLTDAPLEVSTPYQTADLPFLNFQQLGNKLLVTHPNYPPYILTRSGTLDWSFALYDMKQGPFFDILDATYGGGGDAIEGGSSVTLSTAGGAVNASITITASAALFVATDDAVDTVWGRLIRIRPNASSAWGVAQITAVASSTSVTATVLQTVASCTNTTWWRLGSWSETTGFPRTSAVHQQRLVFGGTEAQSQTIWGSKIGDYQNFAPDDGSADENITDLTAYTFTLDTRTKEVIQWLLSRENLLIGTTSQVHLARATSLNEALTARNIVIRPAVGVGCAYVPAVVSQDDIMFIHYYSRQLMEIKYNFDTDRQEAINKLILAEHLTDQNPIQNLAVQDYPYRLVWAGLEDGTIISMTSVPETKVTAWHQHILGGAFSTGNPIIESMTVKPGTNQDELWMVVKRTVNGSTVRYLEVIGRALTSSATRTDSYFVDSYISGTKTGGAIVINSCAATDFSSLEGQTVTVVKNGVSQGTTTITSGALPTSMTNTWSNGDTFAVGLGYTSIIETNTLEIPPTQRGQLSGADQRIFETTFRLHNSFGGEAGYSSSALDDLSYPTANLPTTAANEMFSGDITMKLPHGWNRDAKVYLRQTDPYPMTVTLLINKLISGQL